MWYKRLADLLLPAVVRPRLAWSATKILVAAMALGCLFWWLDAWADCRRATQVETVTAPRRSLWEEVRHPAPPALAERAIMLAACVLTGMVAVWWVARFRSAHRDLLRSEGRLALALDQAGLAIWEFDVGNSRTLARARWQSVFGLPDDFAGNLGEELSVHADPMLYSAAATMVRQCLAGRPYAPFCDYRLRHPDGRERWIRDRVVVVERTRRGLPSRLLRTFQDITNEREAEEQRLRLAMAAERGQNLESLGTMASQVAHDFRNYLTAILGGVESLSIDAAADPQSAKALDSVRTTVQQATGLCRQLLCYSGGPSGEEHTLDLGQALHELLGMLRLATANRVLLRLEGQSGLCVRMDPGQLSQLVLNLVVNAAEAMRGREGDILIRVTGAEGGSAQAAGFGSGDSLGPGPYVLMQVRDQGCGMTQAVARRVFEPFYSTKAASRGLGMTTVLGIVRRNGGAVCVDSVPGQGTCISLLLPLVQSAAEGSSAVQPAAGPSGGS